jgi:hypothetical protein
MRLDGTLDETMGGSAFTTTDYFGRCDAMRLRGPRDARLHFLSALVG